MDMSQDDRACAPELNWSGNHSYSYGRAVAPGSLDELCDVVGAEPRVRVLGTGHSFNALPDTQGALVSLTRMPGRCDVSEDRTRAVVSAHLSYAAICPLLDAAQAALPNLGSLPHISIGGAISTGTHGSGIGLRILSDAVAALTIVRADGEVRTVDRHDPSYSGYQLGLGALGVITEVELQLEPSYDVRQSRHAGLDWQSLLADPGGIFRAGSSVSIFTKWMGGDCDPVGEILLKRRSGLAYDTPGGFGAEMPLGAPSAYLGSGENLTPCGTPGAWHSRLPHFRHDREPSFGNEIQSEYFVSWDRAIDAIGAVRVLAPELSEVLICSELRFVAADKVWLSPAHDQDALALHFTWRRDPENVRTAIAAVEAALSDLRPRSHWGKVSVERPNLDELYSHAANWRSLRKKQDPQGVFVNQYLQDLGLA